MVHKLIRFAAIGLGLSAICMGCAAAVGGHDIHEANNGFFDDRPACEAVPGATAAARDLEWDGSSRAALNFLGQTSYRPGSGERLHASGDPQVLAHLRVRNGTVELDCRGWRDRTRDVTVALPGRAFDKFDVIGGQLALDGLNQPNVAVAISGSGKVQASGKVEAIKLSIAGSGRMDLDQLTASEGKVEIAGSGTVIARGAIGDVRINIAGSGRADLGQVAARNVRVDIAGNGNVDIAPTELADVHIGGSGDVTLHSSPRQLETHIGGSGRIHNAEARG